MAAKVTVTTSTALTALLTQIEMTAAQIKLYGAPSDADGSSMSVDHLAQTLEAMARVAKSSEYRIPL